jgi:hypothetical protein
MPLLHAASGTGFAPPCFRNANLTSIYEFSTSKAGEGGIAKGVKSAACTRISVLKNLFSENKNR